MHARAGVIAGTCILTVWLVGCGRPSKANIALRKEIQQLKDDIATLRHQRDADRAAIARLEQSHAVLETLPQDKLDRLFVPSALRLQRLTVGEDLDSTLEGDEGFKVTFGPVDQYGDEYKSAGSAVVELFEMSSEPKKIGSWSYDTPTLHRTWISSFVLDGYVVEERWQTAPTTEKVMVRVTFTDELTGRSFEASREFTIRPPTP